MSPSQPVVQLAGLQTETRNPRTTAIDTVSTLELCRILQREDARVPAAVEPCVPAIAAAIDVLTDRVRRGGRVFYIGAGTSGRLGVLDASEIPPTYSAPADRFIALIAGGDYALRNAKEGAEDSRSGAEEDLRPYGFDPAVDSLIGVASSGRTPYVLGGLEHVRRIGGATVAVVCVRPSAVEDEGNADHVIAAVTGPESVTGSTRMKAGTATKLVLNMMSTGIMIKLGKTYGNLMIDLKATNIKLRQRAKNMLRLIGGAACTQTDEELDAVLAACHGSVKLAAVTIVLGVSVADAEARLERSNGVLARVFEEAQRQAVEEAHRDEGLVLCVDAGGSSCRAVIMGPDGTAACGAAGPCNVSTIGIDAAMAVMATAIQEATDKCEATRGRQFQAVSFAAAWVGMAGYERPALSPLIDAALAELLRLRVGEGLRVTADIDLLPAAVAEDPSLDAAVVVVAGTGSVAMSYARASDGGGFVRCGRAGGWGPLLGDDGGGYGLGREALRRALHQADLRPAHGAAGGSDAPLSPLAGAVSAHFDAQHPRDLLSAVLMPHQPSGPDDTAAAQGATKRIASAARVVLDLARAGDAEARAVVEAGTASLAELVAALVDGQAQAHEGRRCGLVLAGGLLQDDDYRGRLVDALAGRHFARVETVGQPAVDGARCLQRELRR
ncbi:N-acetylmuramic acid 6-phosphate etherase [Purpureocillium takamizusanense]|uniref:N-acetyl-D-glucosamine kinase n=1 Tax=Purpureocillium takamizusanense TaxID=2060973 RepID=A0A9Q8VA69_9HYPO|nr:N-acetylmuramic acid 6-phosphate etherase [Purpureocillium takamizusanense]UNI17569.1 N-acetylmuramic acid 6-phosphate etherase [Purpureocillium takamizusanense]